MMKKWLISSAIFTFLITGVLIGTSTQKRASLHNRKMTVRLFKREIEAPTLNKTKRVAVIQNSYSFYWLINFSFDILHFFI
ncbi:hypothetical protein OE903_18160 [Bacillus sp. B6(2022)]|nr:hypothetical protein [Bacillus sp. B6(2022)]